MGIKIGDVDVANEIVDMRYQLTRTLLLLEEIMKNNPSLKQIDQITLKKIDDRALSTIQEKYPSMGIKRQ